MTVELIWDYGKERGSECYATYLGDANYLKNTGNVLIAFGGQLRVDGVPVDDIVSAVIGDTVTNSRIVEVNQDEEVVFEVAVTECEYSKSAETYQAHRINIFNDESYNYELGAIEPERMGEFFFNKQTDGFKAPIIYLGKNTVKFNYLFMEEDRLIIDGVLSYDGQIPVFGQAIILLRSKDNTYYFASTSSLNGRFFCKIATNEMEEGSYIMSILGGTSFDYDTQTENINPGFIDTGYKIVID